MHSSVRQIRTRLLILLLRAFAVVLLLSFGFFTLVIGYFLTSASTPVPFPFVSKLEGFYLAKGNWGGVESLFTSTPQLESMSVLLLDNESRLILDRRPDSVLPAGSLYELQHNDVVFGLNVSGQTVGYLVITPFSLTQRFGIARAVILPVGIISFVLATFLVIVSILLTRRFVNPLADVIFAAREVSSGKLNTRIPMKGPQDLRSLSESFNEMASSLERSDRERREMLADIAHELRTPLSVIRGRLEGIVDGIYAENGPQVSMALEQTYLMQRLVDDLRLLTLVETGQLAFDQRDVDLTKIIHSVIDMFSAEAQEKNITLSFSEQHGSVTCHVDPQRFEQVISNLIGNAIRYVPAGSRVWVTVQDVHAGVQITVNDNGKGLPGADLAYIFDRFWRKDKSRSRATGGTGLGLAIAKQLIEAQGGTIEARNFPEGGLQVVIELKKTAHV